MVLKYLRGYIPHTILTNVKDKIRLTTPNLNIGNLPPISKHLLDKWKNFFPNREVFIGGGFVRDHLIGAPYNDIDIFIEMKDDEDDLDFDYLLLPFINNSFEARGIGVPRLEELRGNEPEIESYQKDLDDPNTGLEHVYLYWDTVELGGKEYSVSVNLCFHRKLDKELSFVDSVVSRFDLDICQAYTTDGKVPLWTKAFGVAARNKRVMPTRPDPCKKTRARGRRIADHIGFEIGEVLLEPKKEKKDGGNPIYLKMGVAGTSNTVLHQLWKPYEQIPQEWVVQERVVGNYVVVR